MAIEQRSIVEVPFNLTQKAMIHPALVLSTNEAIEQEQAFVAVMLTSTSQNDEYTFVITNDMLESGRFDKPHQEVRVHLISYFVKTDVIVNSHRNTKVKRTDFNAIVRRINAITFGQTR